MNPIKAQVVDNSDATAKGNLVVFSKKVSENYFMVRYTSPYWSHESGGMLAVPQPGSYILIVKSEDTNEWFYLTSIVEALDPEKSEAIIKNTRNEILDKSSEFRGKPQQIVIQDPKGNALTLSSRYNPDFFDVRAELKSHVGKKLILSDSPTMDAIILRTEEREGMEGYGARLKLTSRGDITSPANAAELETVGPQKFLCKESDMDLLVVDGRELTIRNRSTGLNKNPGEPERYGNVNIESENNDINLTVYEEDGSVFIDSLGGAGLIQLDSGGKVTIHGAQGVAIVSESDINIKAANDVNLEAGNDLNLRGGNIASMSASVLASVYGGAGAAIDGGRVDLGANGREASPVQDTSVEVVTNNYGN